MTQYEYMTQTPIPRLIAKLSIPSVVSMMVTTLYNMVDTWFVAQLGPMAVGACGIAYAIMELMSAIGYLFGMGSGTCIGMLLGARKTREASEMGSTAFFTTFALGCAIAAAGLVGIHPLMCILGASETLLPYAAEYSRPILIGFPIMCSSLVLSTILRCEGKNFHSMIGMGVGAVLNMILDPLFIFGFKMGLTGAAIATCLSQLVGMIVLLWFYLTGLTETKIAFSNIRLRSDVLKRTLVTGLPSLCRHGVTMLATIALNISAGLYGGDMLIAAITIVTKVCALMQSVLKGIFQGAQSIFSYNKGAQKYGRVREAYRFTLTFNTVLIACVSVIMLFAAEGVIRLYNVTDPQLLALGAKALILQTFSLVLMPWNFSGNTLLQSVGEPIKSTFLAALPQGLCYIPALFILPAFMGVTGVICAPILGQTLSAIITLPIIRAYFARNRRDEAEAMGK